MFQCGEVVFSAAGHDKERFYAVVEVGEDGCPLIADGKRRKLQSPKRKNPKHLRPTGKQVELAGIGPGPTQGLGRPGADGSRTPRVREAFANV